CSLAPADKCDAGPARHPLNRLLWRPQATVLLVGYQAVGTLGRLLRDGEKNVRIQSEEIKVAARIRDIDVYSGHADAAGLMRWAEARAPIRGNVFLTHGEDDSRGIMQGKLDAAKVAGAQVITPALDQSYALTPGQAAVAEAAPAQPRLEPALVANHDWHNVRARFLGDLE